MDNSNRNAKDDKSPDHNSESIGELLEKIRQLEKDKTQLEKDKTQLEEENQRKDDEVKRLKKENEIFRKVLRTKKLDADEILAKLMEAEKSTADEIEELRRKANMNSGNSSLPPSSDRPWHKSKNRSLRVSTGRKVGGQKGHPGSTLAVPHEADKVILLYPPGCEKCSKKEECESKGAFACAEKRTVVDLEVTTTVTEYRALRRSSCPFADTKEDTGIFPGDVKAYVQYGNGVAIFAGILDSYGAMSDNRIADVINGISGLNMSASTVISMTERCADMVAPAMEPIANAVAAAPIVNCDETSARVVIEVPAKTESEEHTDDETKPISESVSRNVWIHGASNQHFTCLRMSRIRGYKGMVEANIISRIKGTIIHDCWFPYWKFEGLRHGLCNAHILRELKSVTENTGHKWASMFADLLIRMKKAKEEAVASGTNRFSKDVLREFHCRYIEILDTADTECPPSSPSPMRKRGRMKKGKERSLIERLREREAEICLFVRDFRVPFDNNLAERGFRFVKIKTKVSGCFRSSKGLQQYLDIMSYIDTARKHGVSAFKALSMAFKGQWADAIGISP